jgi:hypothetical protein
MIKSTKAFLLAGASALAILTSAVEANAETFTMPGVFSFTASVSGEYAVEVLGASGGNSTDFGSKGGLGAEVSGDIFLTAGEDLTLFVGGQGGSATLAGGGGGSFVFHGTDVLAVAGGGGGAGRLQGGPGGLAGTGGASGSGEFAGFGGTAGTGGGGGLSGGGGGAGVNAAPAGDGGNGSGSGAGFGGKFPNGGAGGVDGGSGGYGGGGGGGFSGSSLGGGGGGSGFSGGGGGGGGSAGGGGGGGGGGSYLASLFKDPVLTAGANRGDGSISIAAVPEPSTWAMMLAGFAGLGWLAHMRRRKTSPA